MKMVVALCLLTGCMALGQEQAVNIEDYSSSEGLAACKPAQWCWEHDPDTPGQSVGSSWLYGPFRRFDIVWKNFGGQRFHIYFNPAHRDAASTTFTTDTWVYFNKLANVNNIEIDLNQAISDRSTVIFGMQCNFPRGVWQYTTNLRDHAHWNDLASRARERYGPPDFGTMSFLNITAILQEMCLTIRSISIPNFQTLSVSEIAIFPSVGMSDTRSRISRLMETDDFLERLYFLTRSRFTANNLIGNLT